MTVSTPTPIRRAIADDRLLDAARNHRRLLDTALTATGAEAVHDLRQDGVDAGLWHAVVQHADSRRARVRLDTGLGTVVVQDEDRGGLTRAA